MQNYIYSNNSATNSDSNNFCNNNNVDDDDIDDLYCEDNTHKNVLSNEAKKQTIDYFKKSFKDFLEPIGLIVYEYFYFYIWIICIYHIIIIVLLFYILYLVKNERLFISNNNISHRVNI